MYTKSSIFSIQLQHRAKKRRRWVEAKAFSAWAETLSILVPHLQGEVHDYCRNPPAAHVFPKDSLAWFGATNLAFFPAAIATAQTSDQHTIRALALLFRRHARLGHETS